MIVYYCKRKNKDINYCLLLFIKSLAFVLFYIKFSHIIFIVIIYFIFSFLPLVIREFFFETRDGLAPKLPTLNNNVPRGREPQPIMKQSHPTSRRLQTKNLKTKGSGMSPPRKPISHNISLAKDMINSDLPLSAAHLLDPSHHISDRMRRKTPLTNQMRNLEWITLSDWMFHCYISNFLRWLHRNIFLNCFLCWWQSCFANWFEIESGYIFSSCPFLCTWYGDVG